MTSRRARALTVLGAALAAAVGASSVGAQQVTGRVVLPNGENPIPVPGQWVVLHRIGHDSAGPLDSTRTDARGEYRFSYPRVEEDSALFVVSSMRGGVAYFSPPIRPGNVRGEGAEIMVFDTSSARVPIQVQGRHLVIATGGEGSATHQILEVYELSNDTTVTGLATGERGVWSAMLPAGAEKFRIGEGDVSEGGLIVRDGRVQLLAPIAPGLKQISFGYELPRTAFPLKVPILEDVGVLEVVADDPSARVRGAGLREVPPVTSEGRTFKRFLAQDVHRNAVVSVELGVSGGLSSSLTIALVGVLFAAAAGGALALAVRRGARGPGGAPSEATRRKAVPESEVLIRAIADLDARYEGAPADTTPVRAAYEAERSALKERLRAALARNPGPA